jgi:hypothetical protein
MKMQISVSIAFLASGLPLSSAWGDMGHQTVAYIATNFGETLSLSLLGNGYSWAYILTFSTVSSATKTYFQTILGDTTANYLADVATYVDSS